MRHVPRHAKACQCPAEDMRHGAADRRGGRCSGGWRGQSSYAPVDIKEDFATIMARMTAAKAEVMQRQLGLLAERYDVGHHPAADGTKMSRGKPVQQGMRVKLPGGMTWAQLAAMTPAGIRVVSLDSVYEYE
jgi:hypothetical protein